MLLSGFQTATALCRNCRTLLRSWLAACNVCSVESEVIELLAAVGGSLDGFASATGSQPPLAALRCLATSRTGGAWSRNHRHPAPSPSAALAPAGHGSARSAR